jgi:hypothetical protein
LWPKFGAHLRIKNVDSYTSNWNQFVLRKTTWCLCKLNLLLNLHTIAYNQFVCNVITFSW